MRRSLDFVTLSVLVAGLAGTATIALVMLPKVFAAAPAAGGAVPAEAWPWGLAAAALTICVSTVGASWAVCRVGAAAVGALAEKPELFGRLLIFLGLAEGLAIYGLIVSILLLDRLA
jgi:V/A-type H+-transporting ATPase subunit K